MADRKAVRRKASDVYRAQNRILHKAFTLEGLPYEEDKVVWLQLASDILGREIGGLSEMTLSERHKVIAYFQSKGLRLFSPGVSVKIRDWKKGDPDIEYEYREDGDPQVRMVYAMWAEMGYRPKTLRGLCFKLFKCDDPRWLNNEQIYRLVNAVKAKAAQKGLGNYYQRGVG